jgi:hypothetical protein
MKTNFGKDTIMSDIKLITKSQLEEFLSIVVDESLKKSKKQLNENKTDPAMIDYDKKLKIDQKKYGKLVAEVEQEEEAQDTPPDNNGDEDVLDDEIQSDYEDLENISFDRVKDAINRVRSGRSLKDKEIKDSLQRYFEKLDEDERVVFYLFLEELSKIITGAISGKDAQDPGDDPLNIDIVTPDEKADKEAEAATDNLKDEEDVDVEDTTPPADTDTPITVNEAQRKDDLRAKVRRLMS